MTDVTEVQAAPEAAGDDEYETAFGEFAEAREAANEDAAGTDQPQTEEASPAAEESTAEQREVPDTAKELAEVKARAEAAEQRLRSETGRQAALQRKVQELQAQLEAGPKTQKSEREYTAKMSQLMADFPEIAEALQEELDARLGKVQAEVQAVAKPIQEDRARRELEAGESKVREAFPNFAETVKSKEFVTWFHQQPPAVQALAGSNDPNDAIAMLRYYGAPTSTDSPSQVQEIKAKREAALQRNVTVRNNGAPPIGADAPDDFETAFNFYAKKRERSQQRF